MPFPNVHLYPTVFTSLSTPYVTFHSYFKAHKLAQLLYSASSLSRIADIPLVLIFF